jgi:hypothetical protein
MLSKIEGKIILLLVIASLMCPFTYGQRRRTRQAKEQTSFGSETPITRPVKLPKDVLEQLSEFDDGRLKQCQKSEFGRESDITKHFAASAVNINNDGQQDLIVQAQTLCFMGAHNTTFWVFAKVEQRLFPGYDLIFAERADFLGVLKTSTNGYRDIETASHTALELYTTTWKFDGQKYQPRLCTIEDFRTKKVVRVRCSNPE